MKFRMLTPYGNLIRFMLTWQGSEEELDCPLIPVSGRDLPVYLRRGLTASGRRCVDVPHGNRADLGTG